MNIADKIAFANIIAGRLEGRADTWLERELEDSQHPELLNDEDFLRALDERVFCCESCGWYCPPDELADDGICDECARDSGDYDDD